MCSELRQYLDFTTDFGKTISIYTLTLKQDRSVAALKSARDKLATVHHRMFCNIAN